MSTTKDVPARRSEPAGGRNERFNNKAARYRRKLFAALVPRYHPREITEGFLRVIRRGSAPYRSDTTEVDPRWREAPFEGGHAARNMRPSGASTTTPRFRDPPGITGDPRARVAYLVTRPGVSQPRREIPRDFSFNIPRERARRAPRRAPLVFRRPLTCLADLAYPRRGSSTGRIVDGRSDVRGGTMTR